MGEVVFKKVDARLLQQLVEVIATSNTKLTYIEQNELFKAVGECEVMGAPDLVDEASIMKPVPPENQTGMGS